MLLLFLSFCVLEERVRKRVVVLSNSGYCMIVAGL